MAKLENYMEVMVDEAVESFLNNNPDVRKNVSERDILDVKAYSLNKLPAHYITTLKGYTFTKLGEINIQTKVSILKVVVEAFEKVLSNRNMG
ncbi:MAG: Late competence development protein ComFB [Fusobacteriaceae bacterium]|nr:Late competence development protein ComFB [Fusobacteriaceae bacterium]